MYMYLLCEDSHVVDYVSRVRVGVSSFGTFTSKSFQ
jgi:hypothetical protein